MSAKFPISNGHLGRLRSGLKVRRKRLIQSNQKVGLLLHIVFRRILPHCLLHLLRGVVFDVCTSSSCGYGRSSVWVLSHLRLSMALPLYFVCLIHSPVRLRFPELPKVSAFLELARSSRATRSSCGDKQISSKPAFHTNFGSGRT